MNTNSVLAFLLAALLFISPASADEKIGNPVVLELFTSQGCSDAPSADRLAEELAANNKNVTVLTCHVSHFDRSGWTDTLSSRACENRQKDYADTINFLSSTSVPQFIINGVYDTKGESDDAVLSLLESAQDQDHLHNIGLKIGPDTLAITLPDAELDHRADIWLFGFDRESIVDIKAGQNAGSTVKYVNAVRHIVKVLSWQGPSISYTMDLNLVPAEGYTIIAQYERHGKIIGAGTVLKASSTASDQQ